MSDPSSYSRRQFVNPTAGALAAAGVGPLASQIPSMAGELPGFTEGVIPVTLRVNGAGRTLALEPRVTLLDALREHLGLTGTKKGCNHGECGACTVHLDGRRVNACLILAISAVGKDVMTIEGLGDPEHLSPMQQAFIEQDGFQCGFCTPGQIMSAVACVKEGHTKSDEEIREWMSGNICRCSAYPQIVAAIRQAAAGEG